MRKTYPTKKQRYYQGKFNPKNKKKYVGDVNDIVYRSSWELKFMNFLDAHPSVLEWTSETISIPYFWELDGKVHRYYPDMTIVKVNSKGVKETLMIEIKPEAQTNVPKMPKTFKGQKRYLSEVETFTKNQAKWRAADAFCKEKGWKFIVMTEKTLFLKDNKKQ